MRRHDIALHAAVSLAARGTGIIQTNSDADCLEEFVSPHNPWIAGRIFGIQDDLATMLAASPAVEPDRDS